MINYSFKKIKLLNVSTQTNNWLTVWTCRGFKQKKNTIFNFLERLQNSLMSLKYSKPAVSYDKWLKKLLLLRIPCSFMALIDTFLSDRSKSMNSGNGTYCDNSHGISQTSFFYNDLIYCKDVFIIFLNFRNEVSPIQNPMIVYETRSVILWVRYNLFISKR